MYAIQREDHLLRSNGQRVWTALLTVSEIMSQSLLMCFRQSIAKDLFIVLAEIIKLYLSALIRHTWIIQA